MVYLHLFVKSYDLEQLDEMGGWGSLQKIKCAQALYKIEYINSKAV